jgi:hypothetical protein
MASSVKRANGRRFHSDEYEESPPRTGALLLRKSEEFVEALALNFDSHLFHPLDKSVARQ